MTNLPASPRPVLPRPLLDDAWWLAGALTDRPARIVRIAPRPSAPPRSDEAAR